MIKIKVFRFEVSNASSSPCNQDVDTAWYKKAQSRLATETDIEDTINEFLKTIKYRGMKFVSLEVTPIPVNYHNNGRGNAIHLVYTILYKDNKYLD